MGFCVQVYSVSLVEELAVPPIKGKRRGDSKFYCQIVNIKLIPSKHFPHKGNFPQNPPATLLQYDQSFVSCMFYLVLNCIYSIHRNFRRNIFKKI
jgi:hypothetical protein